MISGIKPIRKAVWNWHGTQFYLLLRYDSFSETNRNLGSAGWNGWYFETACQSLTSRWLPRRGIALSHALANLYGQMRSVTTFEKMGCMCFVDRFICMVAINRNKAIVCFPPMVLGVHGCQGFADNLKALEWGQALLSSIIDADLCLGRARVDPCMTDCAPRIRPSIWIGDSIG